nr:SGNH hydrolase domain-containing protein [Aurantiacibacter aquimixticola]
MAVAIVAALATVAARGLSQRFTQTQLSLLAATKDFNLRRDACHSGATDPIPYARTCTIGAEGQTAAIAVWGDSFGAELALPLGEMAAERGGAVRQITASACPPTLGRSVDVRPYCRNYNMRMAEALANDGTVRTVVMVANYHGYGDAARPIIRQGFGESVRGHADGRQVGGDRRAYSELSPSRCRITLCSKGAWQGSLPASWCRAANSKRTPRILPAP